MRTKALVVWTCIVGVLAVAAAPVWAQGGPGPGRRGGPQGFGGPGEGVRFLGAGGCFFGEGEFGRNKKTSASYVLDVNVSETRATLGNAAGTTHDEMYTVFHDGGVTELQTTRKSNELVCINDPADHVRYVLYLTGPNAKTGLEFKSPDRKLREGGGPPPQGGGNGGQNPPWNGKPNPNITRDRGITLGALLVKQPTLSGSSSTWGSCSAFDLTVFTRGQSQDLRVFCSSLGVNLYTSTSDSFLKATTAAAIQPFTAFPVLYPSGLSAFTIKTVDGRRGGRGPHGPPPPQP